MAMVVKNNMSAVNTLNTLNKNSSDMANSLKKVSSGMRVNGAGDDASAYSISERMRVKIRSLGQCEANTETGKSMLKTAERAVNEQVDITKRLKENAIKAANDTCTDEDRKIIQKETNHLLMQMNDISYETNYNGIQLLNGRTITEPYEPSFIPRVGTSTANRGGIQITESGTDPSTKHPPLVGKKVLAGNTSPLNFDYPDLPRSLHNQGFSSLCEACSQFASVLFDANTDEVLYANDKKPIGSMSEVFVIGIKNCRTPEDIGEAILNGLAKARAKYNVPKASNAIDSHHGIKFFKSSTNPAKYSLEANEQTQIIYNGVSGDVEFTGGVLPHQSLMIQGDTKASAETRIELPNTTLNALFPGSPLDNDWKTVPRQMDYPKEWPSDFVVEGSAEYEYYDKKYGCNGDIEQIRKEKYYDEVWPYPRKGASATASCVTTIQKATRFIDDLDQALKYLVNCATTLGAQCQRMEVMNENLVTSDESTQASESLIRDADMAKEMANFTKHNVLTQAAQSALSQANQGSSGVLNLLQ
ncbi:flagellin [Selenomonas ruminantium]|uniref:flagellin n=1 Tax=Selenomonas ruminantium TaxID=971 RepID=UPI0003F50BC4|nr:flagellin [Selenomonas ruminantium]